MDKQKIKFECTYEEINKILGKINRQIIGFKESYGKKPNVIIISNNLALAFKNIYSLMNEFQTIKLNDEYLYINIIFGIACFASPALTGLDFEIR